MCTRSGPLHWMWPICNLIIFACRRVIFKDFLHVHELVRLDLQLFYVVVHFQKISNFYVVNIFIKKRNKAIIFIVIKRYSSYRISGCI